MGLFDLFRKKQSNPPSELAQRIIDYLDCRCEYFPASSDDAKLIAAYNSAVQRGKVKGFTPVIINVDSTLAEWLCEIVHEGKSAEQFRREQLSEPTDGGSDVIAAMAEQLEADYGEDDEEIPEGEVTGGDKLDRFISYSSYSGGFNETVLAYIPTDKAYEVFAWLPFGGWNECPDSADMIKIARYWHEKYGAVPAVVGHDTLEFRATPLTEEAAVVAAREHFAVCPDRVLQCGIDTVGALADSLKKSSVWYFWWD